MKPTIAAIIPAAGSGSRMNLDHPKQFHELCGKPILVHTVSAFLHHTDISQTVVVVPADWVESTRALFKQHGLDSASLSVVIGGKRRQDSVLAGFEKLDGSTDIVLVHDGARPLVSSELIRRCWQTIEQDGAAIAAVPVKDTLKKENSQQQVAETVDRNGLWQAQTPQGGNYQLMQQGFAKAKHTEVTDEAMLLEMIGVPVTLVMGEETNLKITRPEDLSLAESIMQSSHQPQIRIGHGYDAHKLVEGRKLVLGGVELDYHLGLAGHSDADVLTHALCDALLGAIGAGDIGYHFPDTDDDFENIYSIKLLEKVMDAVQQKGYSIANIDLTIICQAPKLAPHLPKMKEILAKACECALELVNIKATTTEKMGFTGRKEGISCHAVALLAK